jgi:hypothetical protein
MLYIVYRYDTIDQVDCLNVGMVTCDRTKAEEFLARGAYGMGEEFMRTHAKGAWMILEVEDGEEFPV